MSEILSVESLSKKYVLQRSRRTTLKDSFTRMLRKRRKVDTILALQDVSFSLKSGSTLGVMGHNGAGKSTLLRLICGIGSPTSGQIHRGGRVNGLLEIGTGFHPALSGRENLMTVGLLNGLSMREIRNVAPEIIEFSELDHFIDQPVRTYSTGMYLRLGFAAAIYFEPDILVIDEVLTVGDLHFRQKCMNRIDAFRKSGKTLIVTTHDPDQVRNLCDEILVLEEGKTAIIAAPDKAINCYNELMVQRTEKRAQELAGPLLERHTHAEQGSRIGTQEIAIENVRILDASGTPCDSMNSGAAITIEMDFVVHGDIPDAFLTLGLYTDTEIKCFESAIPSIKASFGNLKLIRHFRCHLPELFLLPGHYQVAVGLYPPSCDYTYDYHWNMHSLVVSHGYTGTSSYVSGITLVRPEWSTD